MARRFMIAGLFLFSIHRVAVGESQVAQAGPAHPCLAHYTIARAQWGHLPAGVPAPRTLFVALTPCGVARQHAGDVRQCVLGVLRATALRHHTPQQIVDALLYHGDIETALHLDATFCRSAEEDAAERYQARFRGSHSYCTNQCTSAPLVFTVTLDKHTRSVAVQY